MYMWVDFDTILFTLYKDLLILQQGKMDGIYLR